MPFEMKYYNDRKQDVFLSGKYVNLCSLTEDDVLSSSWYDWFNDELTCQTLQKHYFPNTRQQQMAFYKQMISDTNKLQLGITDKDKAKLIGVVSLNNIDTINRNAEFSIVIGDSKYRRKKYSSEALKLIFEHGFFALNLHKIYGGSLEMLKPWVDFLKKKFGFVDEGKWIEHVYKNGKYIDCYRIGLLKNDFVNALKRYEDD